MLEISRIGNKTIIASPTYLSLMCIWCSEHTKRWSFLSVHYCLQYHTVLAGSAWEGNRHGVVERQRGISSGRCQGHACGLPLSMSAQQNRCLHIQTDPSLEKLLLQKQRPTMSIFVFSLCHSFYAFSRRAAENRVWLCVCSFHLFEQVVPTVYIWFLVYVLFIF